jgi:epoxyqueuosine reductase
VAIGNSGDPSMAAEAERLLDDLAPEVRGAAVWALQRLQPDRVSLLAPGKSTMEQHPDVKDEWAAATSKAGQ